MFTELIVASGSAADAARIYGLMGAVLACFGFSGIAVLVARKRKEAAMARSFAADTGSDGKAVFGSDESSSQEWMESLLADAKRTEDERVSLTDVIQLQSFEAGELVDFSNADTNEPVTSPLPLQEDTTEFAPHDVTPDPVEALYVAPAVEVALPVEPAASAPTEALYVAPEAPVAEVVAALPVEAPYVAPTVEVALPVEPAASTPTEALHVAPAAPAVDDEDTPPAAPYTASVAPQQSILPNLTINLGEVPAMPEPPSTMS